MKPILFNTDMVQSILDGRKTVTRRVVKARNTEIIGKPKWAKAPYWFDVIKIQNGRKVATCEMILPPYKQGDILYVREIWEKNMYGSGSPYYYKASPETYDYDPEHWRPSIHMPKEAARIFLRVTDVRVERLQDITEDGARSEGCYHGPLLDGCDNFMVPALYSFQSVWDRTIKKADMPLYGWDANPFVFRVEFERINREEALG